MTEHIFSVHGSDQTILFAIMQLHLGGQPFDLDAAYSVGTMYEGGVPQPRLKFDLHPQLPDVQRADCRHLPLEAGTISSIAFDPPFQWGDHGTNSPTNKVVRGYGCSTTMTVRFTTFKTFDELQSLYTGALDEFHRVLRPNQVCRRAHRRQSRAGRKVGCRQQAAGKGGAEEARARGREDPLGRSAGRRETAGVRAQRRIL